MEPSSDPGTALVLGEGHYNVVLAGAGHRTLEVPRAGPRTGAELADLATCIQVFATAVFDPSSPDTTVARGATAYAAVARSFDIGKPSGALEASKARNSRSGPRLRVVEGGDAPPAMSRNDAGR